MRPFLLLLGGLLLLIAPLLTLARQPEPQSPYLTFVGATAEGRYLYLLPSHGGVARRLFAAPISAQVPSWSPDGRWIVFSDESQQLFRVAPTSRRWQQLTQGDGQHTQAQWSPDGAWIAFQKGLPNGQMGIYAMRPDGSQQQRLSPPERRAYSPFWSPDGAWVAYAEHVSSDNFQLYRIHPTSQQRESLRFAYHSALSWSPEGNMLVFTVRVNYSGDFEIYHLDTRTYRGTRLTGGQGVNMLPTWSPDGAWIIFASTRDAHWELYRMQPDGSQQERLTHTTKDSLNAVWSPNATWVAFASNRVGDWGVYRMRPDGSQQQYLSPTLPLTESSTPQWSPPLQKPWRAGYVLALGGLCLAGAIIRL